MNYALKTCHVMSCHVTFSINERVIRCTTQTETSEKALALFRVTYDGAVELGWKIG